MGDIFWLKKKVSNIQFDGSSYVARLTLDNDVIIQIDGFLRLRYVHG